MPTPVQLVQTVIDTIRARDGVARGVCGTWSEPTPMPAEHLASLRAPNGKALPPALAAWLAFDASWLDLFDGAGRWRTTTARDFAVAEAAEVAEELGEEEFDDEAIFGMVEAILEGLPRAAAGKAPAVRLPDSASQAHILIFDVPDGDGEYPMWGYEKGELWIKYKNFGEFVAHWFG